MPLAMPEFRHLPSLASGQKTTLASRLKEAREEAGLSQVKLAKAVGCSRQFLIALEKGLNKDLGAHLAIEIADHLRIPIRWFVLGDPMQTYARLTKEEAVILKTYRAMPPPLKQHIASSVAALASLQPTEANPFPLAPKPTRK